jgi:hypothetical protein
MSDRKQAAKLFVSEIPGALPLQRHFFDKLQTAEWLPHLANQGLFGEPLATLDEGTSGGMRFRQWPAGNYLLRMAKSQTLWHGGRSRNPCARSVLPNTLTFNPTALKFSGRCRPKSRRHWPTSQCHGLALTRGTGQCRRPTFL